MTEITPGAICTCKQTGAILYVVDRQADDGIRYRLRSFRVTHEGNLLDTLREVGEGDIVVIHPTEAYEPGSVIEHEGKRLTVLRDLGNAVEFAVPASASPLRHGGGRVLVGIGNTITVDKGTLMLAHLLPRDEEEER
jgi:hypothetical protein